MSAAAARPAPLPGAPLPFRQLLDEAVRRTRHHFRRIYPAVAVPTALAAAAVPVAQGFLFRETFRASGGPGPDPFALGLNVGVFALVMLVFLLVSAVGYGAMFTAAVDGLSGREVSMRRAWGFALRPRVLGTSVLAFLAVAAGSLFCLLPGIYLGLLYAFTFPVMVAESRFGTGALGRSSELARYNPHRQLDADPRLHVFITVFVGSLLGYMVSFVLQLPFMVLQQVLMLRDVAGGHRTDPGEVMARMAWLQVPMNTMGALTNTAVYLYICFALALLFFDVRRRKEGFDLEAAITELVSRHRARRPP